ncbi:MAG: hypothetical protein ABMA26_08675 [Limisphaerales bacterium]
MSIWWDKQILKRQRLLVGVCVGAGLLAAWLVWNTGIRALVKPAITLGVAGFIIAHRIEKRAEFLRRAIGTPNQPWLWREEWAARELKFSTWPQVRAWRLVTGGQLVMTVLLALACLITGRIGNLPSQILWLIVGGTGFFTALCAGFTWHVTRRYRRQGRETRLRLTTLPGFVPGKFSATFDLENRRGASEGFAVLLTCQRVQNPKQATKCEVLFSLSPVEGGTVLPQANGRERLEIPVTFLIPPDALPSSRDLNQRPLVRWMLEIKARASADDYRVEFEVPVFNASQP